MTNRGGEREQRPVVVGIDGSECSSGALEWAAAYAEATGTTVRAVAVWTIPATHGLYVGAPDWDIEKACQMAAEEQVASVADRHPGLKIDLDVLLGNAAQVLLELSKTAELLVVGTRGHGAFAGLILGSTSTHCVHGAHCPVVVYR